MQYRTPTRTGVRVSTLSLGAMNFGAFGHRTRTDPQRAGRLSGALPAGTDAWLWRR